MINLPELAARLQAAGLINKSFLECTREEIEKLIEVVFSCPDPDEIPADGWVKPYFDDYGSGPRLIIPFGSHPSYHWWKPEGKKLGVILKEMQAPYDVAKEYIAHLTEEAWEKVLTP